MPKSLLRDEVQTSLIAAEEELSLLGLMDGLGAASPESGDESLLDDVVPRERTVVTSSLSESLKSGFGHFPEGSGKGPRLDAMLQPSAAAEGNIMGSGGVVPGLIKLSAEEREAIRLQGDLWKEKQQANIAELRTELGVSEHVATESLPPAPLSAAEQQKLIKNAGRIEGILDKMFASMSHNVENSRKNAKNSGTAATITGVLSTVVSLAVPIAAPFVGLAARILTFGFQKAKEESLRDQISGLARMLPYVVDHDTAQVWVAKLDQLGLEVDISMVNQLKQLIPVPMELSAVQFVISKSLQQVKKADLIAVACSSPEIGRHILQVIEGEEFQAEQAQAIKDGTFLSLI